MLRRLSKDDLDIILQIRNSKSVSMYMKSRHKITSQEHVNWFNSITLDNSKIPLVYEEQGSIKGFVMFERLSDEKSLEWGFYVKPHSEKGLGKRMGNLAIKYAFNTLNANEIIGEVLSFNEVSRSYHLKLGFTESEIKQNAYQNDETFYDIFVYKLLRRDWREI